MDGGAEIQIIVTCGQLGFAAKVRKDKSKQKVSQMMVWLVIFSTQSN